jgi:hypothetical protein
MEGICIRLDAALERDQGFEAEIRGAVLMAALTWVVCLRVSVIRTCISIVPCAHATNDKL